MTELHVFLLLLSGFLVLTATFLGVAKLHRTRGIRLDLDQGEEGEAWRLRTGFPFIDRFFVLLEKSHELLPGYYRPIGIFYGLITAIVSFLLLLLEYAPISAVAIPLSWSSFAYGLEGAWQAQSRREYVRTAMALLGFALGFTVFVLHIAALFGRRLLPSWRL